MSWSQCHCGKTEYFWDRGGIETPDGIHHGPRICYQRPWSSARRSACVYLPLQEPSMPDPANPQPGDVFNHRMNNEVGIGDRVIVRAVVGDMVAFEYLDIGAGNYNALSRERFVDYVVAPKSLITEPTTLYRYRSTGRWVSGADAGLAFPEVFDGPITLHPDHTWTEGTP